MPFFSVIIPVFNRHRSVKEAIDSVLAQTFHDFEIIVVDDGSTDSTIEIKHEYAGSIQFVRQEHSGVSAARNQGVRNSSAPWIAFLDSDDRWLAGKLEAQAAYIQDHPDVRIFQTNEIWIRNGRRVNPKLKHYKREGDIFIDSLDLCLISPSAAVLSRDCFERYGPFDEDLPACEDYDLWLRVTSVERVGLIPDALVERRGGHADQLSARYPGMDRFRVYSIIGLIRERGAALPQEYREPAVNVALQKTRILLNGTIKRKNQIFANRLKAMLRNLEDDRIGDINTKFLLNDMDNPDA